MTPRQALSGEKRVAALGPDALHWGYRIVWLLCIAVYLTVFIGGVQGGGSELVAMGRAVGFTLLMAIIGRMAMGVLANANLPAIEKPLATQEGTVGSLVDLTSSTNISEQEDEAEAA